MSDTTSDCAQPVLVQTEPPRAGSPLVSVFGNRYSYVQCHASNTPWIGLFSGEADVAWVKESAVPAAVTAALQPFTNTEASQSSVVAMQT